MSFTSPLGPFAIEVVTTFDRDELTYVLDVVSVVESVLDDPMQILFAQERAARGLEIARLKSEGVEYEDRMNQLEHISWPKPLAELLDSCIQTYREHHPWVYDLPSPKSIVREMLETGETFAGFIKRYKLERSEGLLLRYLTDAWRALDRSLPSSAYSEQLEDVIDWLRALLTATDASLMEEWERMSGSSTTTHRAAPDTPILAAGPPPAWRTVVRTAAFGWVSLLARRAYQTLGERTGVASYEIAGAMAPYWATYPELGTDTDARSAKFFTLVETPETWTIWQRFADPEGDHEWGFTATVDIAAAMDEGAPALRFVSLGRFGEEVPLVSTAR